MHLFFILFLHMINFNIDIEDNNEILDENISLSKSNNTTLTQIFDYARHNIFVDMDLPSGTLWCKYNLGVDVNKLNEPSDWYGNYYSWGETKPKNRYSGDNYKFMDPAKQLYGGALKYCINSRDGRVDNKLKLDKEDDAMIVNNPYKDIFSGEIHIPNSYDANELIDNSTFTFIRDYNGLNGLNGYLVKSKSNGNTLFFPCSGFVIDEGIDSNKFNSPIWLSDSSFETATTSLVMYFHYDTYKEAMYHKLKEDFLIMRLGAINRFKGVPIRGVYTP